MCFLPETLYNSFLVNNKKHIGDALVDDFPRK